MININDNFSVNAGKSVDSKYGKVIAGKTVPYASVDEANAAININYRYLGLTVLIDDGSGPVEYWYQADLTDGSLGVKNPATEISFDSMPVEDSYNAVYSNGIKSYVDSNVSSAKGRVFDGEPEGGWKIGDIWLVSDSNDNLSEIRKITNDVYGWLPFRPYSPLSGFTVFSPLYNVLTPNNLNGTDGQITWMAAIPTSNGAQYGPKPTNIYAEYFQKQSGNWVSLLQVVCATDPYNNGHTNPTDGVINTNGDRIAMFRDGGGGVNIVQYFPLEYDVIATDFVQNPVLDSQFTSNAINVLGQNTTDFGVYAKSRVMIFTNTSDNRFVYFRNDAGEFGDNGGPAQITGSAAGGSIQFGNNSAIRDTAHEYLYLGLNTDDNGNDFDNYIELSGGNIIAHKSVTPDQGIVISTSATDPTTADIPETTFKAWKNTTSGTLKLWANDGGILKSVTFS